MISEASFTFVSIREFTVVWFYVNRACFFFFKINGFIRLYFDFVYISSEFSLLRIRSRDSNHRRSRCATT